MTLQQCENVSKRGCCADAGDFRSGGLAHRRYTVVPNSCRKFGAEEDTEVFKLMPGGELDDLEEH
jgi:hypothetical protein